MASDSIKARIEQLCADRLTLSNHLIEIKTDSNLLIGLKHDDGLYWPRIIRIVADKYGIYDGPQYASRALHNIQAFLKSRISEIDKKVQIIDIEVVRLKAL
ncbi:MAG: hypothetical protein HY226_03990 [Candidatus Vogelbacteria bacterium]|nr:hypothetical protein [Candidatus Vogelbacteria bacterium]